MLFHLNILIKHAEIQLLKSFDVVGHPVEYNLYYCDRYKETHLLRRCQFIWRRRQVKQCVINGS